MASALNRCLLVRLSPDLPRFCASICWTPPPPCQQASAPSDHAFSFVCGQAVYPHGGLSWLSLAIVNNGDAHGCIPGGAQFSVFAMFCAWTKAPHKLRRVWDADKLAAGICWTLKTLKQD